MPEIHYNKGVALANLGNYDEAIECYDEAIKNKSRLCICSL